MIQYKSAVFLDRDGTMNYDNGYINHIDKFQFIDGAIEAMQELKKMEFTLIVVTNQSGLARGLLNKNQLIIIIERMNLLLKNHNVYLGGIYYCPHHPKAVVSYLRRNCSCRKPNPGMLLSAQRDLNINMASSYMIGDKMEDMLAAKSAGIGTRVLVRSGKLITERDILSAHWVIDSLAILPFVIRKVK